MRVLLCAITTFACATLAGAAQRPVPVPTPPAGPTPRSELRQQQLAVVVDGCVENRRLKLAYGSSTNSHEDALRATEYILEGPKEVLAQLASEHKGHHEEISGIAIIPPTPGGATIDTRTRTVGGVRVTGSVRQQPSSTKPSAQTPAVIDPPRAVRLRVQAVKHLAEKCQPVD
jgi:hypothetical protein